MGRSTTSSYFPLNPKLHYDSVCDVASDTVPSCTWCRCVLILSTFRGDVVGMHERPDNADRIKVKIKYTLVQALRLCTGRTAHWGSRSIALLFLYHVIRRGEGSVSRPGRSLPPRKDPVPIVQEAGWDPGPVWTGAENLAFTGI